MNDLGWILLGATFQVTILTLAAMALYAAVARRGPGLGATVATACLAASCVLTVLAFCPLPEWWTWHTASVRPQELVVNEAAATPNIAAAEEPPETQRALGLPLSASWFRGLAFGARSAAPQATGSAIAWPGILAAVFLAGAGFGLIRLVFGLWSLRRYRCRSRPISDPQLHLLVEAIQAEIGGGGVISLRKCADLATPATIGWFHPVILLPTDWRDWTDLERRAVLAHELAHIRRHDYLTGLLACLSVALHFYHPLIRWLASRLRLQQELAADELAARLAGGRAPYLLALAGLALRQDGQLPSWPASSFFSTPGTLLRRIAMLRAKEGARPLSRWARLVPVAVLIAASFGLSALRSPAQKTESRYSVPLSEPGSSKELAPFDLSYLPDDVMGVYAVRPEVLAQPEMKATAEKFNDHFAMGFKGLGLPEKGLPPFEQFEQVVGTLVCKTDPTRKENQSSLMMSLSMLRTVKPFDWHKAIKLYAPTLTETKYKNKSYYELPASFMAGMMGPGHCCYIPDDRTIVFESEANVKKFIDTKPVDRLATAPWAADWKRMERGALAVIMDNHTSAWTKENAKRTVKTEDDDFPSIEDFQWFAQGIAVGKEIEIQAVAQMKATDAASKFAKECEKRLDEARAEYQNVKRGTATRKHLISGEKEMLDLLTNMTFKVKGDRVQFHSAAKNELSKLIDGMVPARGK